MQARKKERLRELRQQRPPTLLENLLAYAKAARQLLCIILFYCFAVVFYVHVEGWEPYQALYFTTVTVTTVGYGDFSPATDAGKIVTIGFILVGISYIGGIMTDFIEVLMDQAEAAAEKSDAKSKKRDLDPNAPLEDESMCGRLSQFFE